MTVEESDKDGWRSPLPGPALLFCPADRPDRFAKAMARADGVILDLEDAVAPAARGSARIAVREAFGTLDSPGPLDPDRAIVRINPLQTNDAVRDLSALKGTRCRTIMIAKAEVPAAVLPGLQTIQLVETLRGLDHINELAAAPGCVGLMWGSDDLAADLGGRASRRSDSTLLPHAQHLRVETLLAARRYGRLAIDGPLLELADEEGLVAEAQDAAAMGFWGKSAIHPVQVAAIRRGFEPTHEDVRRAEGILFAASIGGVTTHEGRMVDGPVVAQAHAILAAARRVHPEVSRDAQDFGA